jgi:hypothetical protein
MNCSKKCIVALIQALSLKSGQYKASLLENLFSVRCLHKCQLVFVWLFVVFWSIVNKNIQSRFYCLQVIHPFMPFSGHPSINMSAIQTILYLEMGAIVIKSILMGKCWFYLYDVGVCANQIWFNLKIMTFWEIHKLYLLLFKLQVFIIPLAPIINWNSWQTI